ncbi:hypothetical protein [Pseudosulfitobacter sp. SM2401]|uniref:hypothetical protein n=1 Tax=Pseudosulfitobacter sp. SM2401 TaxID=3350098 RepID=UPI0036F3C97C
MKYFNFFEGIQPVKSTDSLAAPLFFKFSVQLAERVKSALGQANAIIGHGNQNIITSKICHLNSNNSRRTLTLFFFALLDCHETIAHSFEEGLQSLRLIAWLC